MLSAKHDNDVHCVFVCNQSNIDPKVCIAVFTSIRDAAMFADILGVRYVIEPYPRDSVMVRNIKIVESLYYGN
jgi:hypothetical protein